MTFVSDSACLENDLKSKSLLENSKFLIIIKVQVPLYGLSFLLVEYS